MEWWINFTYTFLGGFVGAAFYTRIISRIEKPFRWRCPSPGCEFMIASSDREGMEMIKKSHEHDPSSNLSD